MSTTTAASYYSSFNIHVATNNNSNNNNNHDSKRQAAVSPSSFATSSASNSSSSLNQLNSLTTITSTSSQAPSVASSPSTSCTSSSSCSSSASSRTSCAPSSFNQNAAHNQRHNLRDFRRQLSITPTQMSTSSSSFLHRPSQLFHSHTLHSLEPKPLKPFKTSSEYLEAMKEDLAEWLNSLYPDLDLTPENFMEQLETGAIICRHANHVTQMGRQSMISALEQEQVNAGAEMVGPTANDLDQSSLIETNNNHFNGSPVSPNQPFSSLRSSSPKSQHHNSLSILNSRCKIGGGRMIDWFRVRILPFKQDVKSGTFFARDNICQFILWCRSLNIIDCLLFETDDLVARKNEKSFILCLLEVARIGFKVGMPTPLIIQLEQEIDREIENDANFQKQLEEKQNQGDDEDTIDTYGGHVMADCLANDIEATEDKQESVLDGLKVKEEKTEIEVVEKEYVEEEDLGPKPQVITNDLVSLHEKVVQLLCQCTCPTQFPMVRVGDNGKYKVGDKLIIFVRILRRHIMVRVGGGWQELSEFLRVKDPCRSRLYQAHSQHSNHQINQQQQHHHHAGGGISKFGISQIPRSRLNESSHHLNKGNHNSYIGHRSADGRRLISSSASMSWLSHNT